MTNTQHTPGPWVIDRNPVAHLGFTIGVPASEAMPPASQRHIGNVFTAANARLIAAAPDLLAVARESQRLLDILADSLADAGLKQEADAAGDLAMDIRAAIHEATGQYR